MCKLSSLSCLLRDECYGGPFAQNLTVRQNVLVHVKWATGLAGQADVTYGGRARSRSGTRQGKHPPAEQVLVHERLVAVVRCAACPAILLCQTPKTTGIPIRADTACEGPNIHPRAVVLSWPFGPHRQSRTASL